MHHTFDRRRFLGAALAAAAGTPLLLGQDNLGLQPGERRVDPVALPLDRPGVWTLHFRYKPPRIREVDGFDAKGKKAKQTVWYMWYQVYNRSGEPVPFMPEFELVTRDLNTRHLDEPQPHIFEQLKKFEDPEGALSSGQRRFESTIDISKRPIPPSSPEGYPTLVSGLAIWTDMATRAPRTNRFSVYVGGLSNGVATEETKPVPPENKVFTLIKRKTLRIDFVRPTDEETRPGITDIRPDTATGPAETWVYRTATRSEKK